jgi:hypothetical protein
MRSRSRPATTTGKADESSGDAGRQRGAERIRSICGVASGAAGNTRLPEIPLSSVFEYGLRVGIWPIVEATTRLEVPPSMTLKGPLAIPILA